VIDFARVPGERWVVLTGSGFALSLRFSDPAPGLSLIVDGAPLASLGPGPPAWPLPAPRPDREWDAVAPATLAAALARAAAAERTPVAALLRECPGLGPFLARELAADPAAFETLRQRLARPRPLIASAVRLDAAHDADLAPPQAPVLLPVEPRRPAAALSEEPGWIAAAARWRVALERGRRFERARSAAVQQTTRERRRLEQLELHLSRDRLDLPDPVRLRRDADALLAAPEAEADTRGRVLVADPWSDAGASLELQIDARLGPRRSAELFYARARRAERAAAQLSERLATTRASLESALEQERVARAARDAAALPQAGPGARRRGEPAPAAAPRHYLTSKGLSLLVGRGARQNHELTFGRARPEDLWFHVRDAPGAHVILRDPENRASAADLREAAEVAAFFSEVQAGGGCDVHVTQRKHLRPGRGGPGRVQVFHSETLRVEPRDPEGRLRRRP
jgi:hypothetical protein